MLIIIISEAMSGSGGCISGGGPIPTNPPGSSTTSGPTTTPGPTTPRPSPGEGYQRTVVFVEKQTNPGQDLFIRGGINHDRRQGWSLCIL